MKMRLTSPGGAVTNNGRWVSPLATVTAVRVGWLAGDTPVQSAAWAAEAAARQASASPVNPLMIPPGSFSYTVPIHTAHPIPPNASAPSYVYLVVDGTWTLALPEREETVGDDATHRLGRLFDAHHRRLFTLACRMTGEREDARDLVQETFVRAAGARAIPLNGSGAEAWLVQVLVHLCRDRRRRQRVRDRHAAAQRREAEATTSNPDLDL